MSLTRNERRSRRATPEVWFPHLERLALQNLGAASQRPLPRHAVHRQGDALFVAAGLGDVSFGAAAVVAPGSCAMAGGFLGVYVYRTSCCASAALSHPAKPG
jgi:hypothetical protein